MDEKTRKSWFIQKVKEILVEVWHMSEEDAENIMQRYELSQRIDESPFIAEHDAPESIAEDIWRFLQTEYRNTVPLVTPAGMRQILETPREEYDVEKEAKAAAENLRRQSFDFEISETDKTETH